MGGSLEKKLNIKKQ